MVSTALSLAETRRRSVIEYRNALSPEQRLAELEKIRDSAKGKVDAKFTDIVRLSLRYDQVTQLYLQTIDKRDLVIPAARVRDLPAPSPRDKAIRVMRSPFWYWIGVMGDRLLYVQENIERQRLKKATKTITRAEWEALEIAEVGYKPTLSDYDTRSVCAAWNCHKLFHSSLHRRNSKYCSVFCENEQKTATARLRKHGTYLNVKTYEPVRDSTRMQRVADHEISYADPNELRRDESDIRSLGHRYVAPRPTMDSDKSHTVRVRIPESNEQQREPGEVVPYNVRTCGFTEKWTKSRGCVASWRRFIDPVVTVE